MTRGAPTETFTGPARKPATGALLKVALSARPASTITAATDAFILPVRSAGQFMFRTAPWPTVTRNESKMRLALAWPTQGQPVTLPAQAHGCQNQNVGNSSVLPSRPSWIVIPCISLGWK